MADQDILVGHGRIYVAPTGEANPDETSVAYGAAWGGGWVDIGDFLEPVRLTVDEEIFKVYTQQSTAPKKQSRTRREFVIRTTLAEFDDINLRYVLDTTFASTAAGAGQKAYDEANLGISATVDVYKIGIEGVRQDTANNDQPVRFFFHRGSFALDGDINFDKESATGVPISITVFEDSSQSAGQELGLLQIVTGPATA